MLLKLSTYFYFLIFTLHSMRKINADGLDEIFKWKQISFDLPDGEVSKPDVLFPGPDNSNIVHPPSDSYIPSANNRSFIFTPYNNVPMGVSRYKEKLFITVPRRRTGIPSTLNYINLNNVQPDDHSPRLTSFPNYEINVLHPQLQSDPERIVSVYRPRPDYKCGRLWFIDTGSLEYPGNIQQIQQPSIWILDLENNNKVIRRFEFPTNIATIGRGLASLAIDTNNDCDNAFAYIPDLVNYRLYVYSFSTNSIWAFAHNYFRPDPLFGDFNIAGQQFQWSDGIFSITLGNQNPDGFRNAYFHPMASNSEFMVSTKVLRNQTNAGRSFHGSDFVYLGQRGDEKKQSTMHAFDQNTKNIFYAEVANSAVGCWNTNKDFCNCSHGIVQRSETDMIYPSDLSIDDDSNVWVMTNSMPVFIYSTLDTNAYNFRVWRKNAQKAAQGTICE